MKLYREVYQKACERMAYVQREYGQDEAAFDIFYKRYIDPDGYAFEPTAGYELNKAGKRLSANVVVTADALLSIRRIYYHEKDFNDAFIKTYEKYRKYPIIFFPSERGGINSSRAISRFKDRIDHTLFDIKRYFEEADDCVLQKSFKRPCTCCWLKSFKNFLDFAKFLKIDGIFIREDGEVYDLEKSSGDIILSYSESYESNWSKIYYENVKKKIEEFYIKQNYK